MYENLLLSGLFIAVCASPRTLEETVAQIESECDEICDTTSAVDIKHPEIFAPRKKIFSCENLIHNKLFDRIETDLKKPRIFEELPKSVQNKFEMNGAVKISSFYIDETPSWSTKTERVPIWTAEDMKERIRKIKEEEDFQCGYGYVDAKRIQEVIRKAFRPKDLRKVLVIGSQAPWLEALLFSEGALQIVTLEYQKIKCEAANLTAVTPDALREALTRGDKKFRNFDSVFSYSSMEHSGLGRYGDGINPWGDLIAMAQAWCLTKDGGLAMMGVPTSLKDKLPFNAHRIYGPFRLPHLFANWRLIYIEPNVLFYFFIGEYYTALYVLKKSSSMQEYFAKNVKSAVISFLPFGAAFLALLLLCVFKCRKGKRWLASWTIPDKFSFNKPALKNLCSI